MFPFFPKSTGAWLFFGVTCVIAFFIGQWLRKRREEKQKPPIRVPALSRRERRRNKKK